MYLNLFKAGQALPLRQRRIWSPPILRQLSGGNAARLPMAIRRNVAWMVGSISAVHPPEHPAPLPGNLRANAGSLFNRFRAIALTFTAQCRRTSPGITSTVAGHSPISFPSYAWH
jgi:hypothetical protein